MTVLLFSNNAHTTLGAAVAPSDTAITLAGGGGALFPSPGTGQGFKVTFTKAAGTATPNEIVLCTSRSGDVLTVSRAQEGTSAQSWSLGDSADNYCTAQTLTNAVQEDQYQNGTYVTATATGTNSLTATLASQLTALTDGFAVRLIAAAANTTATTLDLTIGSTATGVKAVVKGNNVALASGDIAAAGYGALLNYNATLGSWVLQNPATGIFPQASAQSYWREWVLFNNAGVVSAQFSWRAGVNFTSGITKNSTGNYTIAPSTAFPSDLVGMTASVENSTFRFCGWGITGRTTVGATTTNITAQLGFDTTNGTAEDSTNLIFAGFVY